MKFNLGFVVRDAHSNGYDSGDLDKREPVSYTLGEAFVFPTEVQAEDRAKVLLSAHPGRDFVVSAVKFVAQQLLTTEEHKEYINEITRMYIKDSALILQDYLDQEKGQ